VLHDQEKHSTPAQQMVGETEEEAHMEEAHEDAPEEQEGSSSKDSDKDDAQQG
jgi:hypothetical protein